jgi:hypothetical protein
MTSRIAATALLFAACAGPGRAERIGTYPDGGSIMLSANSDKAWESAKEMMSSHCDGEYRVLSQAEVGGSSRGGPPPATPSAMADPMGMVGTPYGIRVDYQCTGRPAPPSQEPKK